MEEKPLFSKRDIWKLLLPLIAEQVLNSFMGTIDTVMVSNISDAALSAVSLTNTINSLVIQMFTAMATGGTVVCAQFIGRNEWKRANEAARQELLTIAALGLVLTVACVMYTKPLLLLIFGRTEPLIMENAIAYFRVTSFSFVFFAVYSGSAALFRAQGNSRFPMTVSMLSNLLNIAGNAVLIFGLRMGVTGAALSTLASRIFCCVVTTYALRNKRLAVSVSDYHTIRPNFYLIHMILLVAVPNGIENGMFQFGKLAVQSSVSTMTTTQIAAQALTAMLEEANGMAAIGIALGLVTVVGQTVGAGRIEEAKGYCRLFFFYVELALILSCVATLFLLKPLFAASALDAEGRRLCTEMAIAICVVKPLFWTWSFAPPYAMRAAGDAGFCLVTSTATMWLCRVVITTVLIRVFHFGPMGVWIGMFSDWFARGVIYFFRFRSGKWVHPALLRVKG